MTSASARKSGWVFGTVVIALLASWGCGAPREYVDKGKQGGHGGGGGGTAGSVSAQGGSSNSTGGAFVGGSTGTGLSSGSGGASGGGGQSEQTGTGGVTSSGGGTSGAVGSGGKGGGGQSGGHGTGGTATGGVTSTGGGVGTGGGTGGLGAAGTNNGGRTGTGGTMSACQPNTAQCSAGNLQTCGANGEWGGSSPCGSHQTCTGTAGTAKCTCTVDPICTSAGHACASSTKTQLVTCTKDADNCIYQSGTTPCNNGVCSGTAPTAMCCTNACSSGATRSAGCGTETCQVIASGCTDWVSTATSCGSPLVCERYAGPTCQDPNWAQWPVPNSGAADPGSANIASYTDNGNGTITDNVTKLMWQKMPVSGTFTQPAAVAACLTQTTGGHSDWRSPTQIELLSILDYGVAPSGPCINTTYFPMTPQTPFWSSTLVAGSTSSAWAVDFASEDAAYFNVTSTYSVRCVR